MQNAPLAFYVGPDQVMPVASVLAAALGVLLMFWQKFLAVLRRIVGLVRRKPASPPDSQA